MITADKVIISLRPNCRWALEGSEIIWVEELDNGTPTGNFIPENFTWFSDNSIPMFTKKEYEDELIKLTLEYESTEYQRLRQPEYPPLADLADAIYWQSQGDDSKMTAYLAAVEAVKQKYPKGTV